MKKLFVFSLIFALCSIFCFTGCSGGNTIKLNKKYYLSNLQFMGFEGNRSTIQKYLDSQDSIEEINVFSDYFYLALRAQITFKTNKKGTLTIPQLVASFNSANAEINNKIDDGIENGIIKPNGDFSVEFDYQKQNGKIVIGKIHTTIPSIGDLDFADAITELISYMSTDDSKNDVKIVNENANILEIKNGKLQMCLQLEYRRTTSSENPDVATTLKLKLA